MNFRIMLVVAAIAIAPVAFGHEKVSREAILAIVGRPHDTTSSIERACRKDSDCMAITCRSHCASDGAANKKFLSKITKRCEKERRAVGDTAAVKCAAPQFKETVRCKRKRCILSQTLLNGKPVPGRKRKAIQTTGPEDDTEAD